MPDKRQAPEIRALRVLLKGHTRRRFEAAIDASQLLGTESEGIHHHLRTLNLPETDRLLMSLAYSIWRGFGPTIDIHALWGMDRTVASRMLAGLAAAVGGDDAETVLENAKQLLQAEAALGEGVPEQRLAVAGKG